MKSTKTKKMSGDEIAKKCAEVMWKNDNASKGLGIKIEEVKKGYARLSMTVRDNMTNGQKIAHGGFIFTLADSAFAFACNTRNQFVVAQHCSITFLAPAKKGDRLVATAKEVFAEGRSGLYDISVKNQKGKKVAEFRGASRTVKGQHMPNLM